MDLIGDTSGSYRMECTLFCRTTTFSDYTNLAALAGITGKTLLYSGKTSVQTTGGTSGTLVLNGVSYLYCYIESLSAAEMSRSQLGAWDFTVSFVRDSATG